MDVLIGQLSWSKSKNNVNIFVNLPHKGEIINQLNHLKMHNIFPIDQFNIFSTLFTYFCAHRIAISK